jgi:DNA-binding transcriptional LysR family regulator
MPVTTSMLAPCMREHPHMHYEVRSLSSDAILRQLDEHELDVGLTYLDEQVQAGFSVLPLYFERYLLLSPPGAGERFDAGTVQWSSADGLPLGLLTATMQNRQVINAAFRREGVQPTVALETDSLLSLYAHVQQAGLFSVFPHSLLSVLPAGSGVRASLLLPELTRGIGLIARNRNTLPPLVAAIWKAAEQLDLQRAFDALLPEAARVSQGPATV